MKLMVSFIRKDTGDQVSINMDKPQGDFIAYHEGSGKYALHMVSLQMYERVGNVICGKEVQVTGLTIRVK